MILTGDRDAFQLVSDRVSVMATGRGVTDTTQYTPDAVRERYGIGPELMTDFRGMVGDPSDNLPGVPGIGEKGASQLLQKYGSLDEILAHASEQTPKRGEALAAHADAARKTRRLAVIDTEAPVDLDLDDVPALDFGPERMDALREMFERFQFGSLLRRLEELSDDGTMVPAPPPAATTIPVASGARGARGPPDAPGGRRAGGARAVGRRLGGRWRAARRPPSARGATTPVRPWPRRSPALRWCATTRSRWSGRRARRCTRCTTR